MYSGAKGKGNAPPPPASRKGPLPPDRWPVHVTVKRALTGSEASFDTFSDESIANFKHSLETCWSVPTLCQKLLVHETQEMCQDSERLRKFCPNNVPTATLMLIVSDGEAQSYAQSEDIGFRLQAVLAFTKLALQGSSQALTSLLGFLEDPEPVVRVAAARGTANVARELGDEDAITALGGCMGFRYHDDLNEATAATEALSFLLHQGNETAWTVVLGALETPDGESSREAVKVLAIGALFYKNARALALLTKCLKHHRGFVRQSAVVGIAFAATPGDVWAIDTMVEGFHDECDNVRGNAAAALGSVALAGDQRVIDILLAELKDPECRMMDVILIALSKVAQRGDPEAITAVRALVENSFCSQFALSTYAKLAEHGDEQAIEVLLSRAKDPKGQVRCVAVAVLSKFAAHTDERVLATFASAARDADLDVRIVAVHALAIFADRGNHEAFTMLDSFPQDESAQRVMSYHEKVVTCLQEAHSGDAGAKRGLQHLFNKFWRRWSVDVPDDESGIPRPWSM